MFSATYAWKNRKMISLRRPCSGNDTVTHFNNFSMKAMYSKLYSYISLSII